MNLFDVVPVLETLTVDDLQKHLLLSKVKHSKQSLKFCQVSRMHSEKFALVLGASGDIGHAICQSLAEDGRSIYVHYSNNQNAAQRLCEMLPKISLHKNLCLYRDFSMLMEQN